MTKLKRKISSLDGIEEQYKGLYAKSGDGYVLEMDDDGGSGDDTKTRIAEFRENNIRLQKEAEEARKAQQAMADRYKDIDPEAYKKAQEGLAAVKEEEERNLLKQGKVDEVFARRTMVMRTETDKQIKALDDAKQRIATELATTRAELAKHVIDNQVKEAVAKKAKIRPNAEKDLLNRARSVFALDEKGQIVPNAAGTMAYGVDGQPETIESWTAGLLKDASHLFESGEGGGGGGGSRKVVGAGDPKVVDGSDPVAMGKQLEGIAKGTVTATVPTNR